MKKQHTVTKNNLKLQKIFFIGSFSNVLLCYSKLFSRAEVYLVSDSRKNNRNTQLFLNMSSKLLNQNGIKVKIIHSSKIENIILNSSAKKIYLELGLFHVVNGIKLKKMSSKISTKNEIEFIAINSGVDLLLALASYQRNLFQPRKLLYIYRWKKGITTLLINNKWLIPKISNDDLYFFSKTVEQVDVYEINKVTKKLFELVSVRKCFRKIPFKNYRFLVLALGVELNEKHLKNLSAQVKNINKNLSMKLPYIIKPHPNIFFNQQTISLIEEFIGYPCLNLTNKNNLELIRVLPLESVLNYYSRSIYVGLYTGGVNFVSPKRVFWVPTGINKVDKLFHISYSEFLGRWNNLNIYK